jgi:hypothetical protein
MMDSEVITLPGGFERNGTWQRAVWLRPLVGADEIRLSERAGAAHHAASITSLLAEAVSVEPDAGPAGRDFARALTVGDREAALLHLRRLTFGDRLACVLACPACEERLDLDVLARNLLLPPYAYDQRLHDVTLVDESAIYHVRFRLPTGADQEWAAAALGDHDLATSAPLVLGRCVEAMADSDGVPVTGLPATVRAQLPAIMAELDPQAELLLQATCPACSASFTALFDTAQFLSQEIGAIGSSVLREVHLLALHYHWGESAILGMTRPRRRRYLELLAETTDGGSR